MSPGYQLPQPDDKKYIADIRQLPLKARQLLNTGPKVSLFDGDEYSMQLPRKLFLAATTKPLLIDDRAEVRLPPDTGREAILTLGCYLLALTSSPKPFKVRSKNDLEADLRVIKAARLLHLELYISHIHSWYWWKLCNRPLDAADVQVVLKVALESEDPFVRLVGEKIAEMLRIGTAEGIEKLRAYVNGQPYLKSIVAREDKKHLEVQRNRAERSVFHEAQRACEGHLGQAPAQDEGYVPRSLERKARAERTQDNSAGWERKRHEEGELNKSLQEKMRLGKKVAVLTRAEARYYERMKGKRCPYKISG